MKYLIIIITLLTFFSCTEGEVITINNPNLLPLTDPFTDPRDGEEYGTVTIDGMRWLASNLRYTDTTPDGYVISSYAGNPHFYGQFYSVMTQTILCPVGWHLPSDVEWERIKNAVNGDANKLKSNDADWGDEGTNELGLNIKAAGRFLSNELEMGGVYTEFMTSEPPTGSTSRLSFKRFRYGLDTIIDVTEPSGNLYTSCRCIED